MKRGTRVTENNASANTVIRADKKRRIRACAVMRQVVSNSFIVASIVFHGASTLRPRVQLSILSALPELRTRSETFTAVLAIRLSRRLGSFEPSSRIYTAETEGEKRGSQWIYIRSPINFPRAFPAMIYLRDKWTGRAGLISSGHNSIRALNSRKTALRHCRLIKRTRAIYIFEASGPPAAAGIKLPPPPPPPPRSSARIKKLFSFLPRTRCYDSRESERETGRPRKREREREEA